MRYSERADGAFEIASSGTRSPPTFVTHAAGRQSRHAPVEGARLALSKVWSYRPTVTLERLEQSAGRATLSSSESLQISSDSNSTFVPARIVLVTLFGRGTATSVLYKTGFAQSRATLTAAAEARANACLMAGSEPLANDPNRLDMRGFVSRQLRQPVSK